MRASARDDDLCPVPCLRQDFRPGANLIATDTGLNDCRGQSVRQIDAQPVSFQENRLPLRDDPADKTCEPFDVAFGVRRLFDT